MRADGILLRRGHPDYEECAQKRRDLRQDSPGQVQAQPEEGAQQAQVHERSTGGDQSAPLDLQTGAETVEKARARRARAGRALQGAVHAACGGAEDTASGSCVCGVADITVEGAGAQGSWERGMASDENHTNQACRRGIKRHIRRIQENDFAGVPVGDGMFESK